MLSNVKVLTPSNAKVLFTGKTHVTAGPNGGARSSDGFVDVKMADPHPAAENLFGAAWSACYLGAIQVSAMRKKIKLPALPEVDTQINLNLDGQEYFLTAHLNVTLPGIDRAVAEELVEMAHAICPYSKAVHGNIEITTTVN